MGKIKLLLVSLFVFLSIFPLTYAKSTFYADYVYSNPLKLKFCKKIAAASNYFRVFYNNRFKIKRVRYFHKGAAGDLWKYEYKNNGALARCTFFKNGRRIWNRWKFNKFGLPATKEFFNGYTAPFKSIVFYYDKNNKLLIEKEQVMGKVISYRHATYLPSGIISMKTLYTPGNAVMGRVFYRTDDKGAVLESLHYRWGRLYKIFTFQYTKEGCLISKNARKPGKTDPLIDPLRVKKPAK